MAIYAEGKEHALAVGITKMSTADIVSKNKVETRANIARHVFLEPWFVESNGIL